MLHLAAEERLVVDLGVQGPGEGGPRLHCPIADGRVRVAEVVDGLRHVYPPREFPAHHRLRDGFGDGIPLGRQPSRGILRGQGSPASHLTFGRQRFWHLGVIQVTVKEVARPPAPGAGRRLRQRGGLDGLPIPLKVHLRGDKRDGEPGGDTSSIPSPWVALDEAPS